MTKITTADLTAWLWICFLTVDHLFDTITG
jgi:hypothetical protein